MSDIDITITVSLLEASTITLAMLGWQTSLWCLFSAEQDRQLVRRGMNDHALRLVARASVAGEALRLVAQSAIIMSGIPQVILPTGNPHLAVYVRLGMIVVALALLLMSLLSWRLRRTMIGVLP